MKAGRGGGGGGGATTRSPTDKLVLTQIWFLVC